MSSSRWRPSADNSMLQFRARVVQTIRAFFLERACLEVDTPQLGAATVTDPNIDSFRLDDGADRRFLQTSPEYHMKRLLAAGAGSIWQMSRVFRYREQGHRHNPEFTLVEWYRPGFDYLRLMDEVAELVQAVYAAAGGTTLAAPRRWRYQDLFASVLGLDPLAADWTQLVAALPAELGTVQGLETGDRDMVLDLLFATVIQPAIADQGLVFVCDYPASQAALARLCGDDPRWAERFEVFIDGVELGNGFSELTDATEQRQRFLADQDKRRRRGQFVPPMDESLLSALQAGLPSCAGVALGLERLLMALSGAEDIAQVMAFAWSEA